MPLYIKDDRSPLTYNLRVIRYGKETVNRDVTVRKGNGAVKRFDGDSSGKFIPGVFRVNGMSACRATYVYGTAQAMALDSQKIHYYICSGPFGAETGFKTKPLNQAPWDDALMGSAVQKAHAKLISADLDLGEFLAELPDTINMARNGVNLLLKGIKNAQRSGFTWAKADRARRLLLSGKTYKSLPARLANAWLTWRYGIRPLIWDVQDIIKEANEFAFKSDFSGLRRVRGRVEKSSSQVYSYGLSAGWSGLEYDAKEYVEMSMKGEAVVYFSYGSDFGPVNYILQKYGLHPNQFPYLLWQLVPLSFMLDWFVDVGTWVKAITPKFGMTIHGCSASQKTRINCSRIASSRNAYAGWEYQSSPLHDKLIVECINRRKQTLAGAIPHLKPKIILSIQQQADLLSVLLQRALSNRRH